MATIGESLLEDEVLPLDIALLGQARPEDVDVLTAGTGAADLELPDARDSRRPLRVDRGREGEESDAERQHREAIRIPIPFIFMPWSPGRLPAPPRE